MLFVDVDIYILYLQKSSVEAGGKNCEDKIQGPETHADLIFV